MQQPRSEMKSVVKEQALSPTIESKKMAHFSERTVRIIRDIDGSSSPNSQTRSASRFG